MILKMPFQRFGKAALGLAYLIFGIKKFHFLGQFFWTSVGWILIFNHRSLHVFVLSKSSCF